jgi:hypothetical protein
MTCLCGDLFCPSCGPAQGNFKCCICGRWSEDGGCEDPEACEREARKGDDELATELQAEKFMVDALSDEEYRAVFGHSRSRRIQ